MKILMVCLGNICRSPLAEGILRHKADQAGLGWLVDSAGTERYHVGEAPHPLSQKVARLHGIDISLHRARKLQLQDLREFDLLYAMSSEVLDEIIQMKEHQPGLNSPRLIMDEVHPGLNESVPDPYYGPESGYHKVFGMLDAACEALLRRYLKIQPHSFPCGTNM